MLEAFRLLLCALSLTSTLTTQYTEELERRLPGSVVPQIFVNGVHFAVRFPLLILFLVRFNTACAIAVI